MTHHTWKIGDTKYVGNSDLSGDIEISQPVSDGTVDRIKIPGHVLAIFLRNRLVDVLNEHFDIGDRST